MGPAGLGPCSIAPSYCVPRARNSKRRCQRIPSQSVDYPWDWVSPQLLNRKGEEIYYPVVNDADRAWARRLEWAINHHRDLAQSDLNGLQGECERVLRDSTRRFFSARGVADVCVALPLAGKAVDTQW